MKLNEGKYKTLQDIAQRSFEECYAGLNTLFYNDPHFKSFVERRYRLEAYAEECEFYMTANERYFHTMGFVDAVIFLKRAGYLLPENKRGADHAYSPERFGQGSAVWGMLNSLIDIVEFGDDEH